MFILHFLKKNLPALFMAMFNCFNNIPIVCKIQESDIFFSFPPKRLNRVSKNNTVVQILVSKERC